MANYVFNTLVISGQKEDLENFIKTHISSDKNKFDFNTVIKEPIKESDCPDKYNLNINKNEHIEILKGKEWFNWYDWRYDFWGTKWNRVETRYYLDQQENLLYLEFETANNPVVNVVQVLINMYKNLKIEYRFFEPDMQISGSIINNTLNFYKYHVKSYRDNRNSVYNVINKIIISNDTNGSDTAIMYHCKLKKE